MPSMVNLSVEISRDSGETYRFVGPGEWVVGRAGDCDTQVPDSSDFVDISQHHYLFHIVPSRNWLRVLKNSIGTFVNVLKISPTVSQFRVYDEGELLLGPLRMPVHMVEHDAAESFELPG